MMHAVLATSASIGTASAVEIVWTVTGLLGLYFTWQNLRDARRAIAAIHKLNGKISGEVKIIAFGHYRNEVLRLLKCGVIVAVGVAAMLTPSATHPPRTTSVQVSITIGLLLLTSLIVAASYLDRRQRDLLLRNP